MSQDRQIMPRDSAIAKATRRLIPFLVLCYIVNFLDRVNVGFAALHMNRDLGFSPNVYGLGEGIFFVGYVALEIPYCAKGPAASRQRCCFWRQPLRSAASWHFASETRRSMR